VTSRLRPLPASQSPLPSACGLALLCFCAADLVIDRAPPSAHFALCLTALALTLGALYGLLWQLGFWLVGLLPRRLGYLVWLAASLATGARLAFLIGATKRLHGAYTELAVAVLAGCGVGALLLGLLLCAMQPSGPQRRAFLRSQPRVVRVLVALLLIAAAVALDAADRTLYVGLYPLGHFALRMGALFIATFGFVLVHDVLHLGSLGRWPLLAIALLFGVALLTLDESTPQTLQAFAAEPWPATVLGGVRDLLDFDRDGYSSLLGGGDCAPFDPHVHPGAREIPDNGLDDNCAMGDAHKKLRKSAEVPLPSKPSSMDVVLITVDSLRRDRVGIYDEPDARRKRQLTPKLDAWARRALIFDHAYTPGAWTSLALPSFLRGVYPRRLRWTRFYETSAHRLLRGPLGPKLMPTESPTWLFAFPTTDPHTPLPQWLARRGMRTVAVVDDGRSEILRPGTGIEVGFDSYIEVNPGPEAAHDDAYTTALALGALGRVPRGTHVFLWVHFFGVHSPDEQHTGFPTFGNSVADRYDHEVAYLDAQLGGLLAALDRRREPTAVFVTADHGEELTSHNRHHGYSLSETLIHVPLIARVPGWPTGRSDALVSLVDLEPTILALTDTPGPDDLDGIDLGSVVTGSSHAARTLLTDTWRFDVNEQLIADFVAVYDGRRKVLIDELGHGQYEYDQTKPDAAPTPLSAAPWDPLPRVALGYLEDTGGMPAPRD
jgi:arylsulfatase A-like enzyme